MHLQQFLVVWRRKSDTSGDLDTRGFYSSEEAVQYAENLLAEKAYDDKPRYSLVRVIDMGIELPLPLSGPHRVDWQKNEHNLVMDPEGGLM
mgnify:CR=1 FL=1